jgi:uncharacterized protein (DUF1499 family)
MVTDRIDERRPKRRMRDRYHSTRIYYAADQPPSFLATWTSRIAVFAAVAAIVTAGLHRLALLPTPVAITIAYTVIACAALSLTMAFVAGLDIWVTGRQGAARVFFGAIVALGLLAIPTGVWAMSFRYPQLNDISTDLDEPPEFTEAKDERTPDANPIDYPGDQFATLQRDHYPDLKSLVIPRTTEEAYELVLQAIAKLKLKTTLEVPPEDVDDAPGFIELSEHSQILGLVDDIIIRVLGEDKMARIDVRSASRYGSNDFGRNAEHTRTILKEIASRFEASVPDLDKEAIAAQKKAKLKGEKGHGPGSKADRKRPNLSRSDIRRGLERKGSPQGSAGVQGRGKPRGQFDE